jgi:RND family efflux transporter MFP subunit
MKLKPQGKVAVAVAVIGICAGAIYLLKALAPEAEKDEREDVLPSVEVVAVESGTATVEIASQGIVEAPTETSLAAEVGGYVTSVSDRFKVGQDFKKGDILIEIDPADYASVLAQAEANVADAELNLTLEEGRSRQALRDWKSVGKTDPPSALVLRTPHLKSAEAKLTSAKAAVAKATRDLERTKIRAPYDCRIRATHTEVGSVVAPGTRIADVYELSGFEIRLPVPLDDYSFIDETGTGSRVAFSTTIAGEQKRWAGSIIRGEGVIDRMSRSVYLVAKIDAGEQDKFLRPGLFVLASIAGRELEDIISLPRKALYGNDRVYVIGDKDQLKVRKVVIARAEKDRVLIRAGLEAGGLKAGERVCTTNLAAVIEDMRVKVLDAGGSGIARKDPPKSEAKPES